MSISSTTTTPPAERLTFRKAEKLRHRSLVNSLFSNGKSLYDFPLRLSWQQLSDADLHDRFRRDVPCNIDSLQMMVTVPKKKRKRAVDRVLMRRRIREAYRLNRLPLKKICRENPGIATLSLAFVYMHNANLPYALIERKMKALLDKLCNKLIKPSLTASSEATAARTEGQ